jgi:N-terminal domain of galactosyltransferase
MFSSFIVYFHSYRIDNLLQTIRLLEKNHPEVVASSELILICQDRISPINSKFAKTTNISSNVPHMEKCKGINHGTRIANSDKIIVLDSDRVVPPGYYQDVLANLKPKTVVSPHITHRLTSMTTDQAIIDGTTPFKLEPRKLSNIFSGNATLYLNDYWDAGGMDESYVGYGWEDDHFSKCLLRSGVKFVFREEIEIHLYHPRDSYGTVDQKIMYLNNGIRFHNKWKLPFETHLKEDIENYTRNLI